MTSTSTITTTMTISGTEFLPANMTLEYLSASGSCFGPGGYEPCWDSGYNVSAYVFNCGSAAATPQGCAQQVISTLIPAAVYTINIRYPFSNQTTQEINQIVPSLVNCLWSVQGDVPLQGYAHCISLTSTSFIMGEQAPPPM